jgi:hypothetical protein
LPAHENAPEEGLEQLPELGGVHPSPVAVAVRVAAVDEEQFVGGGDEERPVRLQDPLGLSHQVLGPLQVLQDPEGNHDVKLAIWVR